MPPLSLPLKNARMHGLSERAHLQSGDWADGIEEAFDIVVSNPPYIPSADIEGLQDEVRLFDPIVALDGGPDGLDPYRILFAALPRVLKSGGMFAFEFGIGQGPALQALAAQDKTLMNVRIHKDLSDSDRVIAGTIF
jgi:release factor glutamine methyltransferase